MHCFAECAHARTLTLSMLNVDFYTIIPSLRIQNTPNSFLRIVNESLLIG